MPGAADAADDEGRCLKAEVEILRNHARQIATAPAQLLPQTDASPLHKEGAEGTESLQAHSPDQTLASQQQQQQQGEPQRSGSASEMELAAVEQGLSALDEQITAAALRYKTSQQLGCAHSSDGYRQTSLLGQFGRGVQAPVCIKAAIICTLSTSDFAAQLVCPPMLCTSS